MEPRPRNIVNYVTADGTEPFQRWISRLKDLKGVAVIDRRIARFEQGNPGDHKLLGSGVSELVIDFGPGYRVYYGEDGDDVVLLGGGDKSSQVADIELAKRRWEDYNA